MGVRVSSHLVEVIYPHQSFSVLTPVGMSSQVIGTYGDECNSNPQDGAWTLRNIASVTGDGAKYSILMDANGDALLRTFTDPGTAQFEIIAHIKDLTSDGDMIGPVALDASGNGYGFARYNGDGAWPIIVTTYGFVNWASTRIVGAPALADHWLHIRRVAGQYWTGRCSSDGTAWTDWCSYYTDSRTITQIGVCRLYGNGGTQTIGLERFLYAQPGFDFSGFTGGVALTNAVVEVAYKRASAAARVSQNCVEVIYARATDTGLAPPVGASTPKVYGHSS